MTSYSIDSEFTNSLLHIGDSLHLENNDFNSSASSSNILDPSPDMLLSLSLKSLSIDLKVLLFDLNERNVLTTVAADAFPACKHPSISVKRSYQNRNNGQLDC